MRSIATQVGYPCMAMSFIPKALQIDASQVDTEQACINILNKFSNYKLITL